MNTTQVELVYLAGRSCLKQAGCSPIWVDFDVRCWRPHGKVSRQEGLIRACQPKAGRHILDLSAGLGRDAALLAYFGATLTLVERDERIGLLLQDGITRGLAQGLIQPKQVSLIIGEASDYLISLTPEHYPDVIYYDPMHPKRAKSAKVKKPMQCLSAWIQPDVDVEAILALARTKVKSCVVMKWPAREVACAEVNYSLPGKTVRFDVYR